MMSSKMQDAGGKMQQATPLNPEVTRRTFLKASAAVGGAAVGPTRSLLVLFIGAALGAFAFIGVVYPVVKLRGVPRGDQIDLGLEAPRAELPEVPFGVFLAPAAILVLVWGETLIAWYSSQFLGV